jgi:TonB family protein
MTRIFVLVLVALLSFAGEAVAQKNLARERVSLLFKEMPVEQVLPALARSLGYEISLDPALRALVTLQVENVTAQTALNAICESIGCRWRVHGNRLIVEALGLMNGTVSWTNEKGEQVSRGGGNPMTHVVKTLDDDLPMDFTWSPIDVRAAFLWLARMYDAQVEMAPELTGRKVAVTITSATLRQAFDAVCRVASCRWQLVESPKRVVRVTEGALEAVHAPGEAGLTLPVPLIQAKPEYTSEARRAGIEGHVELTCVVTPDGRVVDVKVLTPLDPGLDKEAVKAAQRWYFKPGTKDGRPVPVRVELEMMFSLR